MGVLRVLSQGAGSLARLPERFGRITTHKTYFSQIDGLRVLALVPVLVWHAALRADRMAPPGPRHFIWGHIFPNGEAGVDLFFAISGFIIAVPFLRRPQEQFQRLGRFYGRRLSRLGPPYLVVLVACFILLSLSGYRSHDALRFSASQTPLWQSFLASVLYLHGVIFNAQPRLNPPLWSLEVEAQFYLIAPLRLAALVQVRRRWALAGALLIALSLLACTAISTGPLFGMVQGKTVAAYLEFFMIGIVCAGLLRPEGADSALADVGLAAGFVLLWLSGRFQAESAFLPVLVRDAVRSACIFAILNGALTGPTSRRLLSNPWMTLVGAMCYSIYLVHVPMMQALGELVGHGVRHAGEVPQLLVALAALIPASLIAGFGFYLAVERPCMDPDWPGRLVGLRLPRRSTI